ncbi:hypothetical protein HK405_001013, partial [Cladochytrium tenue]
MPETHVASGRASSLDGDTAMDVFVEPASASAATLSPPDSGPSSQWLHRNSPVSLTAQEAEEEVQKLSKPDAVDEAVSAAAPLTPFNFALLFIGLFLAIFLAALDQTIVSVALNAIATDFNSLNQIAWVATAYFLTTTAFVPSYGQLADIFGRKWVFLAAIGVFEIGSALCGAATSMNMLIGARAVAGLGGGGIMSLVLIIVSDIVSLKDRGKYLGVLGAAFGLASVA